MGTYFYIFKIMPVPERKQNLVRRLCECFTNFNQIIMVQLDNVSTNQIHKARLALRDSSNKGEMIIGKNTLIKKALKFKTETPEPGHQDYDDHKNWTQDTGLEVLKEYMKLNVGLIFSDESYMDLREKVEAEVVKQPARTGVTAPCDVVIPAGPTGIEVVKEVKIITKGEKVGEGATQMCKLLNIIPFEYKLEFLSVYMNGVILDKSVIDMPLSDVLEKFKSFSSLATAVSLGGNIPNQLSVPHFMANAFKTVLAIGEESGYSFKQLEEAKNATSQVVAAGPVEEKKEEKKVEVAAKDDEPEEESEDIDMGGLFD